METSLCGHVRNFASGNSILGMRCRVFCCDLSIENQVVRPCLPSKGLLGDVFNENKAVRPKSALSGCFLEFVIDFLAFLIAF